MLTAAEVMNHDLPLLNFDISVPEAMKKMASGKSSFYAVYATRDRLHGVVTEAGMVRIFLRYQQNPTKRELIHYRDCFEPIQLVSRGEVFPELLRKLVSAVGHRVFVIDLEGQVLGYVQIRDILPYFTESVEAVENEDKIMISKEKSTRPQVPKEQLEGVKSDLYLYEGFFVKSPFMMHSVSPDGEIRMANEIIHQFLGYDYGELIGQPVYVLYPKENHGKVIDGMRKIFDKGFYRVVKGEMLTKSGESVDVEMVSRSLLDQKGEPVGTVTVSRPINIKNLLSMLGAH